MVTLKQLREKAKTQGYAGYSTMNREQLEKLLRGEKVIKYRKKQVHVSTQTKFPLCQECGLQKVFETMSKKPRHQSIFLLGDATIEIDTGEVLKDDVWCRKEFLSKKSRNIIRDGDEIFDIDTGEVLEDAPLSHYRDYRRN